MRNDNKIKIMKIVNVIFVCAVVALLSQTPAPASGQPASAAEEGKKVAILSADAFKPGDVEQLLAADEDHGVLACEAV